MQENLPRFIRAEIYTVMNRELKDELLLSLEDLPQVTQEVVPVVLNVPFVEEVLRRGDGLT